MRKTNDPRLTEKVRRKTFLVSEKDYLYKTLIQDHPNNKKIEIIVNQLCQFSRDLIIDYVYPKDLKKLWDMGINESLYFWRKRVDLNVAELKLTDCGSYTYRVYDSEGNEVKQAKSVFLDISLYYEEPVVDVLGTSHVGETFLKVCPEEKIVALKNMMVEYFNLKGELEAFLWEWKNDRKWSGPRAFEAISTWGSLYKINKDWFDIVFDNFKGEVTEDGVLVTSEDKIKRLEAFLGL